MKTVKEQMLSNFFRATTDDRIRAILIMRGATRELGCMASMPKATYLDLQAMLLFSFFGTRARDELV